MNPYLLANLKQIYKPVAPTNYLSTIHLLQKLSHRSQVICALEAVKMELLISKKHEPYKVINIIQEVIKTIERWLEGKVTIYEVERAKVDNYSSIIFVVVSNADRAVRIAANIVTRTASIYSNDATENNDAICLQTFKNWWNICYPLIQQELQDKYDILIKNITGEL